HQSGRDNLSPQIPNHPRTSPVKNPPIKVPATLVNPPNPGEPNPKLPPTEETTTHPSTLRPRTAISPTIPLSQTNLRSRMTHPRRGDRVADCAGLENRCTARYRGFESPPLRISLPAFRNPCATRELRKAFLFVPSIGTINGTNSATEFGGFFPFLARLGRWDLPFLRKVRTLERSDHPMRSARPKSRFGSSSAGHRRFPSGDSAPPSWNPGDQPRP